MNKKIQSICLKSVAKIMPLIYFIVGLIVGFFSYLYLKFSPSAIAPRINFWEWILAILIYGALFCLILSLITFIGAFFYNKLNKVIGSVEVSVE
jgi:hypothetical protein